MTDEELAKEKEEWLKLKAEWDMKRIIKLNYLGRDLEAKLPKLIRKFRKDYFTSKEII